jgi:hypothetical protein
MISKREPTVFRKLGVDQEEVHVSHNCQVKVLELLDADIKTSWRMRPIFKQNINIPENMGFIYESKKLIIFKLEGDKIVYSVIENSKIAEAMIRNSIRV